VTARDCQNCSFGRLIRNLSDCHPWIVLTIAFL
jgi:hypothetical protein